MTAWAAESHDNAALHHSRDTPQWCRSWVNEVGLLRPCRGDAFVDGELSDALTARGSNHAKNSHSAAPSCSMTRRTFAISASFLRALSRCAGFTASTCVTVVAASADPP